MEETMTIQQQIELLNTLPVVAYEAASNTESGTNKWERILVVNTADAGVVLGMLNKDIDSYFRANLDLLEGEDHINISRIGYGLATNCIDWEPDKGFYFKSVKLSELPGDKILVSQCEHVYTVEGLRKELRDGGQYPRLTHWFLGELRTVQIDVKQMLTQYLESYDPDVMIDVSRIMEHFEKIVSPQIDQMFQAMLSCLDMSYYVTVGPLVEIDAIE